MRMWRGPAPDGDVDVFDVSVPANCENECADADAWALSASRLARGERGGSAVYLFVSGRSDAPGVSLTSDDRRLECEGDRLVGVHL
jgi:hypothetical protein